MKKETLSRYGIRRGDRQLMVDMNRNLVLNVLRTGAASRADVVRVTGLSPATVSTIVAELIASRLVVETGQGKSTGGRPPQVLKLDDTANYAVGLKLMSHAISVVITDLNAEVVHAELAQLPAELLTRPAPEVAVPADQVLRVVSAAVRDAIGHAGIRAGAVVGVGAGLGGLVDGDSGLCRYSPAFGWHDVQVAAPLAEELDLPVLVDNDVNTLAIAEKWAGDGIAARDFITVSVGRGLGLGIVIDRSVYRGAVGGAGEFGHIIIDPDGPECECGRSGCLEALVGERALLRRVSALHGRDISRDELIQMSADGEPATVQVLTDGSQRLGLAVANVVTLLNPELVIICGEGTQLGAPFLDLVVAAIRDLTFAGLGKQIEVKVQQWGDDAWAVGAATLVLRESFALPGPDEDRRAIWHRLEA